MFCEISIYNEQFIEKNYFEKNRKNAVLTYEVLKQKIIFFKSFFKVIFFDELCINFNTYLGDTLCGMQAKRFYYSLLVQYLKVINFFINSQDFAD